MLRKMAILGAPFLLWILLYVMHRFSSIKFHPFAVGFWVMSAALLVPAIPIAAAWKRIRTSKLEDSKRYVLTVALAIQTASCLHVLLGIINSYSLGPDYSSLRYSLIGTWLVVSCLTAVLSVIRSPIRLLLLVAGAYLGLSWLYIGAISSAV
jgi:hypothetical protein